MLDKEAEPEYVVSNPASPIPRIPIALSALSHTAKERFGTETPPMETSS